MKYQSFGSDDYFEILNFFLDNTSYFSGFCETISSKYLYLLDNTENEYHQDITRQFKEVLTSIITLEISRHLGYNYPEVLEVIEDLDLKEILS